jgi:hypothetical protein
VSHNGTIPDQRAGQRQDGRAARPRLPAPGWLLAIAGGLAAIAAAALAPAATQQAAGRDWQPFVLVTGLLLIGLVADRDDLFQAGGHQLDLVAQVGPDGGRGPVAAPGFPARRGSGPAVHGGGSWRAHADDRRRIGPEAGRSGRGCRIQAAPDTIATAG